MEDAVAGIRKRFSLVASTQSFSSVFHAGVLRSAGHSSVWPRNGRGVKHRVASLYVYLSAKHAGHEERKSEEMKGVGGTEPLSLRDTCTWAASASEQESESISRFKAIQKYAHPLYADGYQPYLTALDAGAAAFHLAKYARGALKVKPPAPLIFHCDHAMPRRERPVLFDSTNNFRYLAVDTGTIEDYPNRFRQQAALTDHSDTPLRISEKDHGPRGGPSKRTCAPITGGYPGMIRKHQEGPIHSQSFLFVK
ncbi:hypothetical protein WH47_12346 [Habropoda laboriosa]|uniref:Uncharacterized protein n=1 Tax=Habropoda laboriosa TaxID=597456 RepID=A0A0L7R7V0_9HYME|nr:hypothetical protein WH47_12346 [Habropoda laboriosa]